MKGITVCLAIAALWLAAPAAAREPIASSAARRPIAAPIPVPEILQVNPWHCRRWDAFGVKGTGFVSTSRIHMGLASNQANPFVVSTTYISPTQLLGRVPMAAAPGQYLIQVVNGTRRSSMSNFLVEGP